MLETIWRALLRGVGYNLGRDLIRSLFGGRW